MSSSTLFGGQRRQIAHRHRPVDAAATRCLVWSSTISSRPLPVVQQRCEHLGGGRVQPLSILDDHQARGHRRGRPAGIAADCLADHLLQLAPLDSRRLVALLRPDAEHRRQQWPDMICGSRPCATNSARSSVSRWPAIGEPIDAAPALQQRPHGVQPDTGMKRRPEQLHHRGAVSVHHFAGSQGHPALADSRARHQTPHPGTVKVPACARAQLWLSSASSRSRPSSADTGNPRCAHAHSPTTR